MFPLARRGLIKSTSIDLAVVAEALGKGIAPDPWLENGVLPARLLAAADRPEDAGRVVSGEMLVACAFAERNRRYSLRASQANAAHNPDGYTLTGEKTLVLGGALADALIVSASCGGETALFLVPAGVAGLDRRNYRIADGSMASEVRLNAVRVPQEARLELSERALAQAIDDARLLAAAEMLGLGQRLFDDTLEYVKQREQFGAPIGSFQAIQHRLVECYAALEQARSMLYRAAMADRADTDAWHRAAAGAKAFIGEQADLVAREAVQMHGGMGVTDELAIGHAMKRVLVLGRLFGDTDAMLAEYAEAA
ncbi:acyl-CoA dehydrogenase [Leptolyngbya sp. 15MV]|nr:acyl-CoA dehydrogenase [Leptolyngbya sp. 15MV]